MKIDVELNLNYIYEKNFIHMIFFYYRKDIWESHMNETPCMLNSSKNVEKFI